MTAFYWVMGALVVLTLAPSAVYLLLYAFLGEEGCLARARTLFNLGRVFALLAFNIGVWGNVAVAAWGLLA
ncbi:MAG TPA: hypothetical protein VFQ16_16905 [Burkholderiaceae bacterium]|nr:hypothetical protein [Burkholderiaceae bacterium]